MDALGLPLVKKLRAGITKPSLSAETLPIVGLLLPKEGSVDRGEWPEPCPELLFDDADGDGGVLRSA